MATLKCLACGHDNNVGDEWCSSCSSSLNLRLCSACEAINANDAERCHSCDSEFRIEPQVVTFEMDTAPPGGSVEAAAPAAKALPAVWRLATDHARKRGSRSIVVFAVLPLLAAGVAYYFYAASEAAQAPQVAPKVEAAQKSEPAPEPEAAPKEPEAAPKEPEAAPKEPASGAPAADGRREAGAGACDVRQDPRSEDGGGAGQEYARVGAEAHGRGGDAYARRRRRGLEQRGRWRRAG